MMMIGYLGMKFLGYEKSALVELVGYVYFLTK